MTSIATRPPGCKDGAVHRGLARFPCFFAVVVALCVCAGLTAGVAMARADAFSPALELHLDSVSGGTTPDSSPNHLTATVQGTAPTDGRFGGALGFSSAGDTVNVANNAVLSPTQVTVMAWVRQSGWPNYDRLLVGKPNPGLGCNSTSYALTSGLSQGVRFVVVTNDPTNGPYQYATPESSTSSVWDGNWHAVAGVYDGNSISLYVDGSLVGATPVNGDPLLYDTSAGENASSGLYAGDSSNRCNVPQYTGDLDEIRVYDRALSAQEIADLQSSTATTPPELGAAPTVSAGPADGLTPQGATLHGTVNPNNSPVSDCHFDYGADTTYGHSVPCAQDVGGGTSAVPVSAALTGLDPGTTYDFRLVATNGVGPGQATGTFTTPAIDTTITGGPPNPTNIPTPAFTFTANPAAGATFVCSIDHGAQTPCSSPYTTGHLADGTHEIEVAAIPPGGSPDATPATRSFVVDTVAPMTNPQVVGGQRTAKGKQIHGAVLLLATATDPAPSGAGVHTRCEYEGAGTPPPASYAEMPDGCTEPIVSTPGSYVFYAASSDAAGNVEAVRSTAFTLLAAVDVSITSAPSGDIWSKQPAFGFTSSTPGATYRCRIDTGAFVPCASPWVSPAQDSGQHEFYVEAVAPDGTLSAVASAAYAVLATQNAGWQCRIQPFLALGPSSRDPAGCEFEDENYCDSDFQCHPIDARCPTGAECTIRMTTSFDDADTGANWGIDASASARAPTGRLTVGSGQNNCRPLPLSRLSPPHCQTTSSATFIGENDAFDFICDAGDFNSTGEYGYGQTTPGPDADRGIACSVSLTIAPAPALALTTAGLAGQVFAPGAGLLLLSGSGLPGHGGRASEAAHARAPFRSLRLRVRRAGVVAFSLHLTGTVARRYRQGHRSTIRVSVVFEPSRGKTLSRSVKLTLIPLSPTLAGLCRANRRLRGTKLCQRLSHPSKRPHR